jgi:phage gp46-like protein
MNTKQDVLIRSDGFGIYDIELNDDGTDLATASGFESTIPVSLFTDARAPSSSVAESRNRRGWIGNLRTLDQNRELGGLLWLYDQERVTAELLNNLRAAAEASLSFMIDDAIVQNVEVTPVINGDRSIRLLIKLTDLDNTINQYSVLWRKTQVSSFNPK